MLWRTFQEESRAMRFATIDLYSGYVRWVGEASNAIDACHRSDEVSGNTRAGEFERIAAGDASSTGYAVYEVPADFEVNDGQNADEIAATTAQRLVGFYRAP
jgi:hypothetical protein